MHSKKIIIVGASSGIGRELAGLYAGRGNLVGITGRRNGLLNELKEQYTNFIFTSCFDVLQHGTKQRLGQLIERLGGLDVLVYCAGYGDPSLALDWQAEDLTTRTNVNAMVEVAGYAFDFFIKQGHGQLVLISSVAGLRGNSWAPAYSASKAFMSRYAESLNMKAAKMRKPVTVTDIRPGFVNTKMARGNGRFWVAPVAKAARQIASAINRKKRVVYITRRWWLVAQLMKMLPYGLYRRLTG